MIHSLHTSMHNKCFFASALNVVLNLSIEIFYLIYNQEFALVGGRCCRYRVSICGGGCHLLDLLDELAAVCMICVLSALVYNV